MTDATTARWATRLLDSYERRTGDPLVPRGADVLEDLGRLDAADAVVLCHDGGEDPRFVYANDAAAQLWALPRERLVGMPSRLSAAPEARADRADALARARRTGLLRGYAGVRRAADGSLFVIRDATLWTVDDEDGRPVGQAATFTSWEPVAADG